MWDCIELQDISEVLSSQRVSKCSTRAPRAYTLNPRLSKDCVFKLTDIPNGVDTVKDKEEAQLFNNVRFKIGGTYTLGYGIGRVKIESPTAKGKTFKAVRLSDDKSIHFGDASMRTRQDNPEAKKNYCSRASSLNEKGFNPNTLSLIYWDCIPANPASNTMNINQIMINSTITKGQIVDNGSHWIIQGIPVTVDNAVMNGITYPADENAKGLPTINQRPITGGHPVRDGYPISVNEDMPEWYIGANVAKHYSKDGIHYVDVKASKKMMKNSDNPLGEYFYNKLKNKESLGVSTGLNLQPVRNTNGEVMATNQHYDHLAFLHDDERPAGGDSTMVRFNSDGSEIMVINLDDMKKSAREREIEREKDELDKEEDRLEDDREAKELKKLAKLLKGNKFAQFINALFGDKQEAGYNNDEQINNSEGNHQWKRSTKCCRQ